VLARPVTLAYWRTLSDDQLAVWGKWAQFLRHARRPLSEFLACPDIACQVDNVSLRMLLWPHRLIPDDGFITSDHDETLLSEAITRLKRFAYADLFENPNLPINLKVWLGQPFTYVRVNETKSVPSELRIDLHGELTPRALDLLEARGRLDLRLWLELARSRMPDLKAEILRERVLIASVARETRLMPA
jgi:hypothetical protein